MSKHSLRGNLTRGLIAPLMTPLMTPLASNGERHGSGGILLSAVDIDEDAAAGDPVGTLTVAGAGTGAWSFNLLDNAGGMFAVDGDALVVGSTALDHDGTPAPVIVMSATDGARILRRRLTLNVRRPLAALPLPTGAKVMGFGHSFMARSGFIYGTGSAPGPFSRIDFSIAGCHGDMGFARMLDPRWNMDVFFDRAYSQNLSGDVRGAAGAYAGVGGERMTGGLARLPHLIARAPDIMVIDYGGNDIHSDLEPDGSLLKLETLVSRLEALLKPIRDAGIWAVLLMPADRTDWPEGDPKHALQTAFGDYIASLATREGIKVCDDRGLISAKQAEGYTVIEDGIHLNAVGHWFRNTLMMPILQDMVATGEVHDFSLAGNLNTTGGFLGTTGAKTGMTGDVATGLTASKAGLSTIVAAKEVIEAGVAEKQVFTVTPVSGGAATDRSSVTILLPNITYATSGIAVGDWVEMVTKVELSASAHWHAATLFFAHRSGANYIYTTGMSRRNVATDINYPIPFDGPQVLYLTAPPHRIEGLDTLTALNTGIFGNPQGVSVAWMTNAPPEVPLVIKIHPVVLRKVVDPRPIWQLST